MLAGVCIDSCPSTTGNYTNMDDWVCLDGVNKTTGVLECISDGEVDVTLSSCQCNLMWESKNGTSTHVSETAI
jgi:hypothetical protein